MNTWQITLAQNNTPWTLPQTSNNFDMKLHYRIFSEEFFRYFYNLYDTNYAGLHFFFSKNSTLTFSNEEYCGYNDLLFRLQQKGIMKFTHTNLSINAQPVDNRFLLATVTGVVSINNSFLQNRFVETILLQRDDYGKVTIFNMMFRVLE